jgi:hypothetical protein
LLYRVTGPLSIFMWPLATNENSNILFILSRPNNTVKIETNFI